MCECKFTCSLPSLFTPPILNAVTKSIRNNSFIHAGIVLATSQILATFVGWMATTSFGLPNIQSPTSYIKPAYTPIQEALWGCWERWDALWYMQIATRGYADLIVGSTDQQVSNFFPAFPLLTRTLQTMSGFPMALSGIMVSLMMFFLSLVLLYQWAQHETNSESIATKTLWLFALFPGAIFFHAPYTEATFVAMTIAMFWSTQRQYWILAGLFTGIGCITRLNGLTLLVPFFILILQYIRSQRAQQFSIQWLKICLGLIIPLLFLLSLMGFWYFRTGDPLQFLHTQSHWGRHTVNIFHFASLGWEKMKEAGMSTFGGHFVIEFIAFAWASLMLIWISIKKGLPLAQLSFLWINMLIYCTSSSTWDRMPMLSMERYMSALFLFFFFLARKLDQQPTAYSIVLVIFSGLFSICAAMFVQGAMLM